ncbi:hypothetical protein PV05_07060 [Exophiala xenobiotica]|uniref:Molybdopterin synthase sulfur carrier subunit n=1 Tax=Exophiala xenobiotica TaxID=348802 RepID=A0A0D2EH17_9EURO|nr:uncharacterized protein PV05_07060 [Exophiala xenobiotica]KIW54718.1 hypothetical protein PV05_07060 [Exophiala xenobiotica]
MAGSAKVFSANDGTGTFTLLLFASASTYTGIETLTLPAPTTLRELFRLLEGKFPGITDKVLKSSAVTVNLEYVDSFEPEDLGKEELRRQGEDGEGLDTVIRQGDEVGIIPPVSSG